jgi:D-methionine transport system ATP-binding protein
LFSKEKPALASLLRVENLAYILPYRSILSPLTFEVVAGEMIVVTGASGVGKTLLLRLLNRLTEPSRGNVFLANQDYRLLAIPQLRREVVFISAEPNLLGMSAQESLLYPLQLQRSSVLELEEKLAKVLDMCQIPKSWLPLSESQLSKGQCQLVSLARSLILQPQVLLWDEPTKYLDDVWIERVRSIAQEQEMSVVVATRKRLTDFTGRVLYLLNGQISWDKSVVNWEELGIEIAQAEDVDW